MGHIQMLGKSDDWQMKGAAPRGLGWAPSAPYGDVAKHSIDFWLSSEDLPLADSRVTLRRTARSGWRCSRATTPKA